MRGHLRAVAGTAQHPDLGRGVALRHRLDGREGMPLRQRLAVDPGDQVGDVAGELRRALVRQRVQGEGGAAVGAGGAAEAEVDAARSEEPKSELQAQMSNSSAAFCLKKKTNHSSK